MRADETRAKRDRGGERGAISDLSPQPTLAADRISDEASQGTAGKPTPHAPLAPRNTSVPDDYVRNRPARSGTTPTIAGGLLFLLPVLARLGYADWLEQAPDWQPLFIARRMLARVSERLALPANDPAWQLGTSSPSSAPDAFRAPSNWIDGIADCRSPWRRRLADQDSRLCDATGRLLLARWQGRRLPPDLPPHLCCERVDRSSVPFHNSDPVEDVTEAWLTACRRWVRRRARMGVANLTLRHARLTVTPTHVDVDFELSDLSLEVRRAGLDLNPGWLPWFGRVVSFHYGRVPWI
jgi:hypothetical protein